MNLVVLQGIKIALILNFLSIRLEFLIFRSESLRSRRDRKMVEARRHRISKREAMHQLKNALNNIVGRCQRTDIVAIQAACQILINARTSD